MAIKKSFIAIAEALQAFPEAFEAVAPLMEAKKGGFSGEDMFITINDAKVARICAMTGAVFAHDNSDKTKSFFYKNGSYMIGAEVLKANSRKGWELQKEQAESDLEAQMLDGEITPQEWKEQKTALDNDEFAFTLTDEEKQDLVDTFEGFNTKDAFIEAYNANTVKPFTDFEEEIKALRELAPKREEA